MHLTTNSAEMDQVFSKLETLQAMGSFDEEWFPVIDQIVNTVADMKKNGHLTQDQLLRIQHFFGRSFLENTLHGMALTKPFGYAGDFLMIDRIYTGNPIENVFFQSWDNYFQNHAAPRAVRNRKTYFKEWVKKHLEGEPANFYLLNVASGPGRDLLELYKEKSATAQLRTTCVEMDPNAIAYASRLVSEYASDISFIQRNIFKFDSPDQYNLIWSAGLFDYFDDKTFLFVLKKFKQWVQPGGEIVIGNFNQDHNPSRNYMELFGEWYLHHRKADQLRELALAAGFDETQISLCHEPEKVNLFLHIRN